MLKEYHYDQLIRWPKGERACVFLTFDFQGGEDVKPDKNGVLNYEMWSQGEYGPHHAIYRLLRILKEENVKATFLTCGAIAERFPEAVQAILDHGHVVEGHGYNHEIARYLPREQEDPIMKKTIAMIQKRTGRRCYGWRSCTQSTNTIELLIENGFVFNTNCFHEELPFLWEKDGKLLVELPRQPFGDGTLFGHRHGEYGNPHHGLETWKAYFDELYSESTPERPKYIPFTMHPYIIGRPGRTLALRGIIQHMRKVGGDSLWFPTGIELAEYCLNNVFKAEAEKLRAVAG
jgi:peptidoglycan/xylan/chitin deacetylase (PgdA/CDA1 family)